MAPIHYGSHLPSSFHICINVVRDEWPHLNLFQALDILLCKDALPQLRTVHFSVSLNHSKALCLAKNGLHPRPLVHVLIVREILVPVTETIDFIVKKWILEVREVDHSISEVTSHIHKRIIDTLEPQASG